jgi:hypothetical protein
MFSSSLVLDFVDLVRTVIVFVVAVAVARGASILFKCLLHNISPYFSL